MKAPFDPTRFPNWEDLYKNTAVETMPWYSLELDQDLAAELKNRKLTTGKFIDIGTGPGTQAVQLARLGFEVTGTDLSQSAVDQAAKLSDDVDFIQDDILNSRIQGSFDFVFDRGCFHTLPPETRAAYSQTVRKLLNPGGLLFLKTFSREQPGDWGPHRFNENDVRAVFQGPFEILSARAAVYQGTLPELPKALFVVLRKK